MSHIVAVHQVDGSGFAGAQDQMGMGHAADGIGQEDRAAGTEVGVVGRKGTLVVRGEIIGHGQAIGSRELDEAVAVFRSIGVGIEGSVGDLEIEIRGGIHKQAIAAHPKAAFARVGPPGSDSTVRRRVENVISQLLESALIEPQDPAMIWVGIGETGIDHIQNPSCQSQRGALKAIGHRIKRQQSAGATDARCVKGRTDDYRAGSSLGAVDDVQGMNSMDVIVSFMREGVNKEGP